MEKLKILIIDDEKSSRDSARRILRKEDYQIFFAINGKDGLAKIDELKPDLILLDVFMPVMNGIEVLKKLDLKKSDDFSIIVLSGHGTEESIKTCYDLGVTAFVHKPFASYELKGLIKNTLDLIIYKRKLQKTIDELNSKTFENRQLKSILPICSNCKKIHDDHKDEWEDFDHYINEHTDSQISHGLCPDCIKKLYPREHKSLKDKGLIK